MLAAGTRNLFVEPPGGPQLAVRHQLRYLSMKGVFREHQLLPAPHQTCVIDCSRASPEHYWRAPRPANSLTGRPAASVAAEPAPLPTLLPEPPPLPRRTLRLLPHISPAASGTRLAPVRSLETALSPRLKSPTLSRCRLLLRTPLHQAPSRRTRELPVPTLDARDTRRRLPLLLYSTRRGKAVADTKRHSELLCTEASQHIRSGSHGGGAAWFRRFRCAGGTGSSRLEAPRPAEVGQVARGK